MKGNDGHVTEQMSIFDLYRNPQTSSVRRAGNVGGLHALCVLPGSSVPWQTLLETDGKVQGKRNGKSVDGSVSSSCSIWMLSDQVWLSHTERLAGFLCVLLCTVHGTRMFKWVMFLMWKPAIFRWSFLSGNGQQVLAISFLG